MVIRERTVSSGLPLGLFATGRSRIPGSRRASPASTRSLAWFHAATNLPKSIAQCAKILGRDVAELEHELDESRAKLFAARQKRVRPSRDDKVIVAWNGLMIDAMARAGAALDEPRYVVAADDAAGERDFYSKLFGWNVEVNPDPQYGGYGIAKLAGEDAAGIGGKQDPNTPTAWTLYIGTDDIDALARRVTEAGGTVAAPPFDVGDQGRMAVFQDQAGAFISAWQGTRMGGFSTDAPNSFGWAELNARGVDKALPFYSKVFGWSRAGPTTACQV